MKHLVIIGAGGMGRCLYTLAQKSIGYLETFDIKGFIDDNTSALDNFTNYPPVLSTIEGYEIEEDDIFTCSIGNTGTKRRILDLFKNKGGEFITLIHKDANIGQNTRIGKGSIIDDYCHIDPDVTIGEDCLIQSHAIIGHDCIIGNNVRIDTHCTLVGGTIVKNNACIFTLAMINHNVIVGENAVVGACSFVIKKVKPGTTVFGVPAKTIY